MKNSNTTKKTHGTLYYDRLSGTAQCVEYYMITNDSSLKINTRLITAGSQRHLHFRIEAHQMLRFPSTKKIEGKWLSVSFLSSFSKFDPSICENTRVLYTHITKFYVPNYIYTLYLLIILDQAVWHGSKPNIKKTRYISQNINLNYVIIAKSDICVYKACVWLGHNRSLN